ncbi:MAG: GNAT family N-acetyltransferase [Syntrophorhabdales bacterium]|jgi:RimJ/RimL family protein N-acetyltransferase
MATSFHKIKGALYLLSRGYIGVLLEEAKRELVSEETSYAFRRDLSLPVNPRPTPMSLTLRPFERADIALLALDNIRHGSTKALMDRISRIALLEAGIPSCYVAVAADGSPCFIQWLISPAENEKLDAYYKGYFLPLAHDEVLLEGAYIPESHRGKGIMGPAMSQVAEKGRAMGARWAVTYVEDSNLPSIRGCLECGFHPYLRKKALWRGFRREVFFTPLSEEECSRLEGSWQL